MSRNFNKFFALVLAFLLALLGAAAAKTVHPSSFAASKAIDVPALLSASEKTSKVPALATYPLTLKGSKDTSTIHSDWASFQDGAAFVFKADMDTDCDGLDYKCDGNADGQPVTNWGALSAFEVPYIVIPQAFLEANPVAIPGNNVAAVICNKKMFYAILGDTNGNNPQVTGEASLLLARTCFSKANLSGDRGHEEVDVTYIVYTGPKAVLPPTALDDNYITDFDKLRSMGDDLTTSLSRNLGISLLSPGSPPHDEEDDSDQDGTTDGTTEPSAPGPPDFGSGASVQSHRPAPQLMALFVALVGLVVMNNPQNPWSLAFFPLLGP
ncbi:fungal chitosanase of glycosyl hydrolase group 75-domain-containing protein [Aspergillus varians]